jgi:anthranilate synthase component I
MKIQPDFETFKRKCGEGNLIPCGARCSPTWRPRFPPTRNWAPGPDSFLLESVEQGAHVGRFSFLGCDPPTVIQSRGEEVIVRERDGAEERFRRANPVEYVREYMSRYRPVTDPALPPFIGGAVGYLAYDLVRRFERLPDNNPDALDVPDLYLMISKSVVAFDHLRRRLMIIHSAFVEGDPADAYAAAEAKVRELAARLRSPLALRGAEPTAPGGCEGAGAVASNMTPDAFEAAVERAREYIRAGDIFQVVLSQRFSREYKGDPFDVYRALRAVNPSPYMFYFNLRGFQLAGSSPEVLVTVHGGEVILRPIAGTRPRGANEEEDEALERDLLADPKERAEHIMLVDLGRNDCGRVSAPGSVRVNHLMVIERYSHVMHIVSDVRGRLKPDCDGYDALQAALPAGTLSGAPKIRAMEIIDELENLRRGPYGGACGYFGFNGNVDFCITIRTVLLQNGFAQVQAGAGIVADSVPRNEFLETENKARGMFKAIEMAEQGLD